MNNYKRNGAIKEYAHTAIVASGELIAIGARPAIAMGSFAADEVGSYLQGGVIELPKRAALALLPGVVYGYDISLKEIVPSGDALSDFDIGEADVAADAADATGLILINNMPYSMN